MLLSFDTNTEGHTERLAQDITEMVVAGWAGRDRDAIEHHIDELAAIGVPRPSKVPLFYRVAASSLTQTEQIQVLGDQTSGEAEPFVFSLQGELYVTVASDHTDRKLEAHSVALSKQICAKPVAHHAWRWREVREHWGQVRLCSWIQGEDGEEQYQEGPAGSLVSPEELLDQYLGGRVLPDGLAMSCGTVSVIGAIRPAGSLKIALHDPVLGRRIEHQYRINVLPEVA